MIIRGNTTATTTPRPDWNQTDPAKPDYLPGRDALAAEIQQALDAAADASQLTRGTVSSDRLPTLPLTKGGTGATTAAAARSALGAVSMATKTATLSTSGWSSLKQTVTVSGVTSGNTVIVAPAGASFAQYRNNGVYCSAQGTNSLTFTCEKVPTAALTVNVLILT